MSFACFDGASASPHVRQHQEPTVSSPTLRATPICRSEISASARVRGHADRADTAVVRQRQAFVYAVREQQRRHLCALERGPPRAGTARSRAPESRND